MFCKHNYKLIDKTILESGLEQLIKDGLQESTNYVSLIDIIVIWPDFYKKKVVLIFQCEKCSAIKKIVEQTSY